MLEDQLKQQAHALGFELAGIAPALPADGFPQLQDWLRQGFAGEMDYMHRHADARRHPASIMPEVKSVLMLGMKYGVGSTSAIHELVPSGRVAKYAQGPDYHRVIWDKLDELLEWLKQVSPACEGRGVVDTAPLLERDFARRAGLGWIGKNTMLMNKHDGSFFFLAALLVNLDLQPDPPHVASHCGTCTACLDACPTQAFVGPGQLDARRCISYLTIELRSSIPEDLRTGMGDWLFGCDVCQDVCPWNSKAKGAAFPHRADLQVLDLIALLALSEDEFRQQFRGTALLRSKRRGLLRNAAIVLGNVGDSSSLPALERALSDVEPQVREAAAWAIDQVRQRQAGLFRVATADETF